MYRYIDSCILQNLPHTREATRVPKLRYKKIYKRKHATPLAQGNRRSLVNGTRNQRVSLMAINVHRYSESYAEALRQFAEGKPVRFGPLAAKAANSMRMSLYRYKTALFNAPAEDLVAQELADIFMDVMVSITESDDGKYVELTLNPLVAAMRQENAR